MLIQTTILICISLFLWLGYSFYIIDKKSDLNRYLIALTCCYILTGFLEYSISNIPTHEVNLELVIGLEFLKIGRWAFLLLIIWSYAIYSEAVVSSRKRFFVMFMVLPALFILTSMLTESFPILVNKNNELFLSVSNNNILYFANIIWEIGANTLFLLVIYLILKRTTDRTQQKNLLFLGGITIVVFISVWGYRLSALDNGIRVFVLDTPIGFLFLYIFGLIVTNFRLLNPMLTNNIRQLINSLSQWVFITNKKGEITDLNDLAIEFIGLPKANLINEPIKDWMEIKEITAFNNGDPTIEGDNQKNYSAKVFSRSGDSREFKVSVKPIYYDKEMIGYSYICTDLTHLYQQQKEIEELLNKRNLAKGAAFERLNKKEQILEELKSEIKLLVKSPNINMDEKRVMSNLKREIDFYLNADEWKQMMLHFEETNPGFYKKLSNQNKKLTALEAKHCAYILLGMTKEEVANLLRVSINSINVARFRLRKKMDCKTDQELKTFLEQL